MNVLLVVIIVLIFAAIAGFLLWKIVTGKTKFNYEGGLWNSAIADNFIGSCGVQPIIYMFMSSPSLTLQALDVLWKHDSSMRDYDAIMSASYEKEEERQKKFIRLVYYRWILNPFKSINKLHVKESNGVLTYNNAIVYPILFGRIVVFSYTYAHTNKIYSEFRWDANYSSTGYEILNTLLLNVLVYLNECSCVSEKDEYRTKCSTDVLYALLYINADIKNTLSIPPSHKNNITHRENWSLTATDGDTKEYKSWIKRDSYANIIKHMLPTLINNTETKKKLTDMLQKEVLNLENDKVKELLIDIARREHSKHGHMIRSAMIQHMKQIVTHNSKVKKKKSESDDEDNDNDMTGGFSSLSAVILDDVMLSRFRFWPYSGAVVTNREFKYRYVNGTLDTREPILWRFVYQTLNVFVRYTLSPWWYLSKTSRANEFISIITKATSDVMTAHVFNENFIHIPVGVVFYETAFKPNPKIDERNVTPEIISGHASYYNVLSGIWTSNSFREYIPIQYLFADPGVFASEIYYYGNPKIPSAFVEFGNASYLIPTVIHYRIFPKNVPDPDKIVWDDENMRITHYEYMEVDLFTFAAYSLNIIDHRYDQGDPRSITNDGAKVSDYTIEDPRLQRSLRRLLLVLMLIDYVENQDNEYFNKVIKKRAYKNIHQLQAVVKSYDTKPMEPIDDSNPYKEVIQYANNRDNKHIDLKTLCAAGKPVVKMARYMTKPGVTSEQIKEWNDSWGLNRGIYVREEIPGIPNKVIIFLPETWNLPDVISRCVTLLPEQ